LIDYEGDLSDMLISLMCEQSGRKSWEAAIILSKRKDDRAAEPMKRMLTSPHPTIGQVAAEFLARYDRLYVDELITALPQSTHLTQITIITVLGRLGDVRAVKPLMIHLLRTESTTVMYTAIRALAALGNPAAILAIRKFEFHDDHHVRTSAAAALNKLTDLPNSR
jgi:HEAT repeat protein